MRKKDPNGARALLAAGASLRTVLTQFKVYQSAVGREADLSQPRVCEILAGGARARRQGQDAITAVRRAAAKLLGIRMGDIPEEAL